MTEKPLFDARAAQTYDQGMGLRVPGYDLSQDLAAAVLATALPDDAHILVVGAGTGSEVLRLAAAQPRWRFTALDISRDMLDVARQRLLAAGHIDRVDIVCAPMQATTGLPAHDAALAQLVSQFVPHADKAAFYAAIAAALRPGASLLSLDYRPELSPGTEALRHWALAAGARPEVVDMMAARIAADWHIPAEPDLLRYWAEAGLSPHARYIQALAYTGTLLRRE